MRSHLPALIAGALLSAPAQAQEPVHQAYRPGIHVTDYEFSLDLPEAGNVIDGRAVLSVRRTSRVDTLTLDLLSLKVDSVLVNQRPVHFRRDSSTIGIPLPAGSNDSLGVTVRYRGP